MTATATRVPCASFSRCIRTAERRKSPQNKAFSRNRRTYSEKAHCIKDRVLLDGTCGSGGLYIRRFNEVFGDRFAKNTRPLMKHQIKKGKVVNE